jgi:L-fuconolactonase
VIVDSHQHFWNYQPQRDSWIDDSMAVIRRDFTPADLQAELTKNGVSHCVAIQADPSEAESIFLLDLADTHEFIAGVVGWVDLCAPNAGERLAHFARRPKFKGVRHLVQSEPDPEFMLRPDFKRGIAALAPLGLTYDLLIKPHQLKAAIALVGAFPEQPFVLDHLGKPGYKDRLDHDWARALHEMASYPNVYAKLSGLVTESEGYRFTRTQFDTVLETALEAFGAHRLLFGSDWPVCLLAASYGEVLDLIQSFISTLSASEQAAIMGKNAQYFYQL